MFKFFYIYITSLLIFLNSAFAENINIFKFTEQELRELDVRKVRGADNKTIYSVGSNEKGNFLKAVADNAASGLGKEVKIDLENLEFVETSIVGEVEIWIDTTTNKHYEIPIDIHRDFLLVIKIVIVVVNSVIARMVYRMPAENMIEYATTNFNNVKHQSYESPDFR